LLLFLLALLSSFLHGQQLDRCESATTTPFDGFTDTHLSYAAFDRRRNSQVSFGNPFTAGAKEGAIWFWMRLTRATEVEGLIVDCQGGVRISINRT